MGYFPNGTEGIMYQEDWCDRCVHDRNQDCPVWAAHLLHNYAECNNKGSILHMLIPRSADGLHNEACRLFIEREASADLFQVLQGSRNDG